MEQDDALRFALGVIERLGLDYMVVGSYASSSYGEVRLTQDIDIVLALPPTRVAEFCRAFPEDDYYVGADGVRSSVAARIPFNVLHTSTGSRLDFMPPRTDEWGRGQLARRRIRLFDDLDAYVARPEDVILGKLWYHAEGGSDKPLRDIAGILGSTVVRIDRDEVDRWADRLGYGEVWRTILAGLPSDTQAN